jgi:hypothetical protein
MEMRSVRRRTSAKLSKKGRTNEGPSKGLTPDAIAKSGTEHGEQAALFFWAAKNRTDHPCLRWLYAIPNGGGRSPVKGVSDVCLPVPRRSFNGLYIEMKRKDGTIKDVKPEQAEFLEFVQSQGYYGCVCFGWEQASKTLEWYLCESV